MAKVSELTGAALDWAVATADGYPVVSPSAPWHNKHGAHGLAQVMVANTKRKSACHYAFRPSESWGQGGPIIDREAFNIRQITGSERSPETKVEALIHGNGRGYFRGPTALVAAMRCYVASKLGDDVEIPDELATTVARTL